MDDENLKEFAKKYTAAWCSQNAASVSIVLCGERLTENQ